MINKTVQPKTDIVLRGVVFTPHTSKNKAAIIMPNA